MSFVMTSPDQLGPILKGLRKARALTQLAVARQSGLTQKTVSLLETDPARCRVDTLARYLATVQATLSLDLNAPSAAPDDEAW